MDEKSIAAKIYLQAKSIKDLGLLFLQFQNELKSADINAVLIQYNKILSGKIKVVEILSSIELNNSQKEELKGKIEKLLTDQELAYVYQVDSDIETGLMIRIGDSLLDLTINNLISED